MNELKNHRPARSAERLSNHETWFTSEVEKGLAAADRGELTDHEAVRAMIDSRYLAIPSAKGA